DQRSRRDNMIFESIARLKPGASLQAGRARVAAIAERVAREHPEARKGWSTNLIPIRGYVVEPSLHDALIVLLVAVGAVLLIVCVNVANLLLARGTSRSRELAIRTALGANRGRLARQLLTESVVLAFAGGTAGVDVDHVIAARLSLPGRRYPQSADCVRFYQTLTQALATVPGVRAAAATSYLPAGGGGFGLGRVFLIEGGPEPPSGPDHPASWNVITPEYFRTLGIPLIRGRAFDDHDTATSTPVIVINDTLARRMFPGGDAIGHRIRSWRDEHVLREIVGIVPDVRYSGLADQDRGLVYVPHQQDSWSVMVVAVRAAGNPAALAGALRETVNRIDP